MGLARDSIQEEFDEHAEDEAEHIENLQRYLLSMGVQPTTERYKIPPLENPSMEDIIALQLEFENLAVETYSELARVIGDDGSPLLAEIQNILAKEKEHSQDLEFLLR